MNENEELFLKSLVDKGSTVWWTPDVGEGMKVKHVKKHDDEPGLCAFLENGTYVALYNEEISNFSLIKSTALSELMCH